MKPNFTASVRIGLISVLLIVGFCFYIYLSAQRLTTAESVADSDQAEEANSQESHRVAATPVSDLEQRSAVSGLLESMAAGLKTAGAQLIPSVADQLHSAVATGDRGEIIRAFHESIYGRWQKRTEALPAVRTHLSDSNSFVQYCAAVALFTIGDRSGYETLMRIVNASEVIADGDQDLRVEAARELAKFRQTEAATSILSLYNATSGPGLLSALVTLKSDGVAAELERQRFYQNKFSIIRYGALRIEAFVPQIANSFQKTGDLEMKAACAWALARTGDAGGITYLIETAQAAISANQRGVETFDASAAALRYLGSLQSPAAKPVLERALESDNAVAVRYAVVNLLFNQAGGSEKAKQVVLRELRGERRNLGTELLLNVASKLRDPEVQAAGEAFDQRSGDGSWKLYSVERRDWPIYNWIDDYIVTLN